MRVRYCLATLATFLSVAVPALGGELVRVSIDRNRFEPKAVQLRVGAAVEWVNDEKRTSHTVLFENGEESERMMPGDTFRKVFAKPGKYPYRCGPHPEMAGVVEVVP